MISGALTERGQAAQQRAIVPGRGEHGTFSLLQFLCHRR